MSIPAKEKVISELQKYLGVSLSRLPSKKVFYNGKRLDGSQILVCTPESKLHVKGHGWFDLTTIQEKMLDESDYSILAFRLDSDKIYYLNFHNLKPYLTIDARLYNKREGDHWKLYVWPNYLEVRGNSKHLQIKPNNLENL